MKRAGREANAFCRNPDLELTGVLLFGSDAGLIASRRRALISAVLGENDVDMRLTEIASGDARKDPACVGDAMRARGFFPGRQVVLIQGGADSLTKPLTAALEGMTAEDAMLVVTADVLPARSSLRKLFESSGKTVALQFYDDPPGPADLAAGLKKRGLSAGVEPDALDILTALASDMDHGSVTQLLEVIALFGLNHAEPLSSDDIQAIVPTGLDIEIDRFIAVVASGHPNQVGPTLRRLTASGAQPVSLLIGLQRHFRMLLTAATASGGPEAGLASVRPPLWGKRRSDAQQQLRHWNASQLEQAAQILFDCDAHVRSSRAAPDVASVERCALRLAIIARK